MAQDVPVDEDVTVFDLESNPYPIYERLRRESPVVRLQSLGRIVFTKAEDTNLVKTTPDLFGSHDITTPMQVAFRGHTLMRKDGVDHLTERNAMADAFSHRKIAAEWKPAFTLIVEEYISRLTRGETVDLHAQFAGPLAARCLARVLGIDVSSDDQLQRWAPTLIEGAMNASRAPDIFARCDAANDEMDSCFDYMIDQHRQAPNCSALSIMANAEDPLPISQIRTNLRICIGGGLVETRDGLLTTLFGLLTNPDQLDACKTKSLWRNACEEGLRWVAPIQASPRLVLQDTDIRGCLIPKGESVMAIQASANHDEDIWSAPELFDIRRPLLPNQSFGEGAHSCLGEGVYRTLISEIILPMLFDRFPDLTLPSPEKVKFWGFGFRGPLSLPVTLR